MRNLWRRWIRLWVKWTGVGIMATGILVLGILVAAAVLVDEGRPGKHNDSI